MDSKEPPSSNIGSEGPFDNSSSEVECGEQQSLPLHSAPPLPNPRTWEGGRSEYLEITRDRVVPKVMELAQRLVPAVTMEFERGGGESRLLRGLGSRRDVLDNGQGNHNDTDNAADSAKREDDAAGMKTTGLCDVDVESGLCLPQSAAMAASGLALPDGEGDNFVDVVPVVPVDTIAAGLDSDVALMDIEADALLASIRSTSQRNEDEDSRSVSSFDSADDDGMGGEVRRLGQVVASLRQDLAGANLSAQLPRAHDSDAGRSSETHSPTSYLAEQLQTWKYFGLRSDAFDDEATRNRTAALIWAIALLWALIILLSGRMKHGSDVDGSFEESWTDYLFS